MSVFNVVTSGLAAAQAGVLTTSHNIANVNTPGYSRQESVQSTPIPTFTGAGFMGNGVEVATIRRIYSEFLAQQTREAGSQAGAAQTRATQLQAIDRAIGDPASALSPALSDFFAALNDLAAQPADRASRQATLSMANALAARFQSLDGRLVEARRSIGMEIASAVDSINAYSQRIAEVNRRIVESGGATSRLQPANDLLDQRDRLLTDLSSLVRTSTAQQEDGSINVFIGGGQALVVGQRAHALAAVPDPESPQDAVVALPQGGAQLYFRAEDLPGGKLGGLLAFAQSDLPAARNALGRIASALADEFNRQHQLGQDRHGDPGGAFFSVGEPGAVARAGNAGSAQLGVSVVSPSALAGSSYRMAYDGAQWQLTKLSDGSTRSFATLPQTVDGVAITLASGSPAAGDSFRIEPTAAAASGFAVLVSDPNRLAAAAPVRAASAASNGGTARIASLAVQGPPPVGANLTQTVTITFTASGTFDVSGSGTGNPAGLAYTPGMTVSFNGWSATLDGSPAAGDVFTVSANTGGIADNRNANLLAGLQQARPIAGGSASLTEAYATLVSDLGNRTRTAQITAEAQTQLARDTEASAQALSGVNLDEEAAMLLRYQQAYQAAGKALSIADRLFDTLLQIGR